MGSESGKPSIARVWAVAANQHDRISLEQLLAIGLTYSMVRHRVQIRRLFPVRHSVFAVSHPRGTDDEAWMEAVLAAGKTTVISDEDGFALWGLGGERQDPIKLSAPAGWRVRRSGLMVRQRAKLLPGERRRIRHIPVTSPALTLIDNANRLGARDLEAAVDDAAAKRLCRPDQVRTLAERYPKLPGSKLVREVVDRHSFRLTESELERMVLRILWEAGLPLPDTQVRTGTGRVDFIWSDLGLVVEADSLLYHRTASRQAADARRDAEHALQGLATLRITHWDAANDPDYVATTIGALIEQRQSR